MSLWNSSPVVRSGGLWRRHAVTASLAAAGILIAFSLGMQAPVNRVV